MQVGLLSILVTGALLLPQSLSHTDDNDYDYADETSTEQYMDYTTYLEPDNNTDDDYEFVTSTEGYIDYSFDYDSENTTSVDYSLYATLKNDIKRGQSKSEREKTVVGGMSHINDKTSTLYRYCAVGLGLMVQCFCQHA